MQEQGRPTPSCPEVRHQSRCLCRLPEDHPRLWPPVDEVDGDTHEGRSFHRRVQEEDRHTNRHSTRRHDLPTEYHPSADRIG